MRIIFFLMAILVMAIAVGFMYYYRKKTIKIIFKRSVVYDESEFYMLLSKYRPDELNTHRIYGAEKQHAIIIEEYVVKIDFWNGNFKKVKSCKKYVEYYVP